MTGQRPVRKAHRFPDNHLSVANGLGFVLEHILLHKTHRLFPTNKWFESLVLINVYEPGTENL